MLLSSFIPKMAILDNRLRMKHTIFALRSTKSNL